MPKSLPSCYVRQVIFVDVDIIPLLEKIAPSLKSTKHIVVMTDRAHMPKSDLFSQSGFPHLICYEELMAKAAVSLKGPFKWPSFSEEVCDAKCSLNDA